MKRVYSALPMLRVVEYLTKPPTVDPAELDRINARDHNGRTVTFRPARPGEERLAWTAGDGRQWVPVGKGES